MKKVWFLVLGITALLFLAACSTGEATSSNECKKLGISGRCGFVTGEDLVKTFKLECAQFGIEPDDGFMEDDSKEISGDELCAGTEKPNSECIGGFVLVDNTKGPNYLQLTSCSEAWNFNKMMIYWNDANSSGLGANDLSIVYTCCGVED